MHGYLRPMMWGFLGMVAALVCAALLLLTYKTYIRSVNGEMAWECLHSAPCLQSAVRQLPAGK